MKTKFQVDLRNEQKKDKEDTFIVVNLLKKEAGDLTRKNQQL